MAYSTVDDVRREVGGGRNLVELADLEETAASFGSTADEQLTDPNVVATIERAITAADGYINGYLKQRLQVPLAVAPPEIVNMSSAWAARILRRGKYKAQPLSEDQEAEKADRQYLKGIADGHIQLGLTQTPPKSDIVIDKAAPRAASLHVSRRRLRGFI